MPATQIDIQMQYSAAQEQQLMNTIFGATNRASNFRHMTEISACRCMHPRIFRCSIT